MLNQQAVAARYARELAQLASALHSGQSCLVECDKELTPFLCAELRDRLRHVGLSCIYADGRPRQDELSSKDIGVISIMLAQLRRAVRQPTEQCVIVTPHLDVLAAQLGGLSPEAREVIPLLYEVPEQVWLGFHDPSLPLLSVVEKRFPTRFKGLRTSKADHLTQPSERAESQDVNPVGSERGTEEGTAK